MSNETLNEFFTSSYDGQNAAIDIGVYDVFLPCRRYRIQFKIAEMGKVSLTTEFLLRLIHSVDGMYETDIANFFDFSATEMTFLLNDAVNLGYLSREKGRLWLTNAGRNLFVQGEDCPQIFNVETKTLELGFDLISFAPQERGWTDYFDPYLPELSIDPSLVSKGRGQINIAFKKHFTDITYRRDYRTTQRKSLYSIDDISAGDRFATIVPVVIKAHSTRPSRGEPDLSVWRRDDELEQRPQITSAMARFVDDLRVDVPRDASDHYRILQDLAPDLMGNYSDVAGVAPDRFYHEVVSQTGGGFHKNRKTVPIIGPLVTIRNAQLVLEGIARTVAIIPNDKLPPKYYWCAPNCRHWGRTRLMPELMTQISLLLTTKVEDDKQSASAVLIRDKGFRAPDRAFTDVVVPFNNALPRYVEILLVPGIAAAVLVHLPIEASSGHAVPLGFVSIDPIIVMRTEVLLKSIASIEIISSFAPE